MIMKRGTKPMGKVKIKWSAKFAYALGLLATDGCLSGDNRHIILTSKDKDQLENFNRCLKTNYYIGIKRNGEGKEAFVLQFGDVLFFKFLEQIGITKKKSLTMCKIKIPDKFFWHFLRGCFDGDGCTYSYLDPRWKSSFMFYLSFASSSLNFLKWIQDNVRKKLDIVSHISVSNRPKNIHYQLKYSKYSALKVLEKMYYQSRGMYLKRKRLKIDQSLGNIAFKAL
jgi:intein-encoded DNA endonuclease-like protein